MIITSSVVHAADPVILDADEVVLSEQYELTVIEADHSGAPLYRALSLSDWKPYGASFDSADSYKHGIWLRFELRNPTDQPQDRVLKLHWPTFNKIGLYEYSPDSNQIDPISQVENWSVKEGQVDQFPYAFALTVPASTTQQYYLYLKSYDKVFPVATVFSPEAFDDWRQTRTLVYGLFFGVLLAMLAYNFCLFVFLRDASYGMYCVYVTFAIFYILLMSGTGFAYIWNGVAWVDRNAYGLFPALTFWAAGSFVSVYLGVRDKSVRLWRMIRAVLIAWVLLIAAHVGFDHFWLNNLTDYLGYISCVFFIFVSLYFWYHGDVLAKYLAIAWLPLILTTFYLLLGLSGLLVFTPLMHHMQIAGFTIEVFLLSMALAARINYERKQRIEAQNVAMESILAARESRDREHWAQKQLLAQEQEAKKRLHEKVASRTRELQSALDSLEEANRQLVIISGTDGLTGLHNRGDFDKTLIRELNTARRNNDYLSFILMDIDFFKSVNDTHGHQVGDQCLKKLANCIKEQLKRSRDYCARYGGEEFCVLLPGTDPVETGVIAERLRLAVSELEVPVGNTTIGLTISLGYSGVKVDATVTGEALLASADQALYQAKGNGRNQSCMGNL